jgi:hypothetical protein
METATYTNKLSNLTGSMTKSPLTAIKEFFKLDNDDTRVTDKTNERFEVLNDDMAFPVLNNQKISFNTKNLTLKILKAFYPKEWELENIAKPSLNCRQRTADIAINLLNKFELQPDRVRANIEEGITLYYKNYENDKELILEVYNTLEMAVLVNEDKKIIRCIDFGKEDDADFKETIQFFKS